jgi:hypothetical protein
MYCSLVSAILTLGYFGGNMDDKEKLEYKKNFIEYMNTKTSSRKDAMHDYIDYAKRIARCTSNLNSLQDIEDALDLLPDIDSAIGLLVSRAEQTSKHLQGFTAHTLANPREDLLAIFLARQIEWSTRTFGGSHRTLGILKHIEKEIAEVKEKPEDLTEWIDIIILAIDGYWRHGGTPETIMRDLMGKAEINYQRVYPMPTSEDEPSEHVREEVPEDAEELGKLKQLEEELLNEGIHRLPLDNLERAIRADERNRLKNKETEGVIEGDDWYPID